MQRGLVRLPGCQEPRAPTTKLGTILKRTTDIDDHNFVNVVNNNIWANLRSTITNGLISGYCARTNSRRKAIDEFVVAGGDSYHVGRTVAKDVGRSFNFRTMGVGPSAFHRVRR